MLGPFFMSETGSGERQLFATHHSWQPSPTAGLSRDFNRKCSSQIGLHEPARV
jgi:hypothetical protein